MDTNTPRPGDERRELRRCVPSEEGLARLARLVPADWSRMSGELKAPRTMVDSGEAVEKTGVEIRSVYDGSVWVRGEGLNGLIPPNLLAMIVENRRPGYVVFREAGMEPARSLSEVREIALGLVALGYYGILCFYNGSCWVEFAFPRPMDCFGTVTLSWVAGREQGCGLGLLLTACQELATIQGMSSGRSPRELPVAG